MTRRTIRKPAPKYVVNCAQDGLKRSLRGAAGSIVVALVLQAGSLIWWASAISQRVTFLENNLASLQREFHEHKETAAREFSSTRKLP
jgi:hypothetical protein